jgi:hypothetical protein
MWMKNSGDKSFFFFDFQQLIEQRKGGYDGLAEDIPIP